MATEIVMENFHSHPSNGKCMVTIEAKANEKSESLDRGLGDFG